MAEVRELTDLPAHRRREIEHFFRTYKDLNHKFVEIRQWLDRHGAAAVNRLPNRYLKLKGGEEVSTVPYVFLCLCTTFYVLLWLPLSSFFSLVAISSVCLLVYLSVCE